MTSDRLAFAISMVIVAIVLALGLAALLTLGA
jgi:hypothetical protein